MKKKRTSLSAFVLLLASSLILLSCKKEKTDYRNKWIGTYHSALNITTHINMSDTTYYSTKKTQIKVKKTGDSVCILSEEEITENEYGLYNTKVKVQPNGTFTGLSDDISIMIKGAFKKDSIFINYNAIAPGFSLSRKYKGEKN